MFPDNTKAPARLGSRQVDRFLDEVDYALMPLAPAQQEELVLQIWSEFMAAVGTLVPGYSLNVALARVKDGRTLKDAQTKRRQVGPVAGSSAASDEKARNAKKAERKERFGRGRGSATESMTPTKRGRGGKGRGRGASAAAEGASASTSAGAAETAATE